MDLMKALIIRQRDCARVDHTTAEGRLRNPATLPSRIHHGDLVTAAPEAPGDRIAGPGRWNASIYRKRRSAAHES
jgi:hypothetical protein